MEKQPLILIIGPTAVGKTALSLELARDFRGEIISGDSMQVYRKMDIGTAKVNKEEQAGIPHHLIDILDPDQLFSVQEFQTLARQKIEEIAMRGNLPFVVGGTGLYIDALVYEYQMPRVIEDPEFRQKWRTYADQRGNLALHQKLQEMDPVSAKRLHPNDRKRIIRAMEVTEKLGVPFSEVQKKGESRYDALWIGLTMPREQLYQRINERVDLMLEAGWLEEVENLRENGYQLSHTAMQAIGYKELNLYLEGKLGLQEAINQIKKGTRKFAKRQLSWFRRISDVHWFDVNQPHVEKEIRNLIAGKFSSDRE